MSNLPAAMSAAYEVMSLQERVNRLEQALDLSLDALQRVVGRLDEKFGPELLGDELRRYATVESTAALEERVDAIDRAVTAGEKPAAARCYREAFDCTWDQAHQAISQWSRHASRQQVSRLRLARYIAGIEQKRPK